MVTLCLLGMVACIGGIAAFVKLEGKKIGHVITMIMTILSSVIALSLLTYDGINEDYLKVNSYTYITEENGEPATITVETKHMDKEKIYEKDDKFYMAESNAKFLFVPFSEKEMVEVKLENKIYNVTYNYTEGYAKRND
jgi:hypothetical protein